MSDTVALKDVQSDESQLTQRVLQCAYLAVISTDSTSGKYQYSGRTMLKDEPLLFTVVVDRSASSAKCTIQSENTVLNSMLLKQLKGAIAGEATK